MEGLATRIIVSRQEGGQAIKLQVAARVCVIASFVKTIPGWRTMRDPSLTNDKGPNRITGFQPMRLPGILRNMGFQPIHPPRTLRNMGFQPMRPPPGHPA